MRVELVLCFQLGFDEDVERCFHLGEVALEAAVPIAVAVAGHESSIGGTPTEIE